MKNVVYSCKLLAKRRVSGHANQQGGGIGGEEGDVRGGGDGVRKKLKKKEKEEKISKQALSQQD